MDDNLICSDKIGSGVFFWSFPSKAYQDLLQTEERLKSTLSASKESIEKLEHEINELAENRQRPDRGRLLEHLARLQEEEKMLDRELESLKSFDPEHIEKVLQEAKRCKLSADRWTDNVWLIRAYMTRKLGRSSKEVIDSLLLCSLTASETIVVALRLINFCTSILILITSMNKALLPMGVGSRRKYAGT